LQIQRGFCITFVPSLLRFMSTKILPTGKELADGFMEFVRTTRDPDQVHIITFDGRWRVLRQGRRRATASLETKEAAIAVAKELPNVSKIIVHGRDGSLDKEIRVRV
jgi:hypothetical protein